ncbi:ABC transporter substrate-binding protein [Tardiphaga robiniae]|uniref:ABC transporter substrate-binding protein n=1 Tax=Tardiphaga TaxID=1395974 RepID=UPI0028598378|nr:ABC transporter substrate-binding protein [Tardiphaga robiniae]MDR6663127.1 branched-chain amino acid transport system substrate-binding protein [Tardiphaga robiniae]
MAFRVKTLLTLLLLGSASTAAQAGDTIKIGDLNSYKAMVANTQPYRNGLDLAIAEANAAGGVLGKRLEMVYRDDGANPNEAVRAADELILRENVDILTGTILSHVGLAVADFAKQRKMFFLASAPLTDKLIWENGNRYTYRLRPSTYTHAAALVPDAVKLKKKRWAMVYPNYEYGQSAVATFKALLKKQQPDVEFVADLAPPLGKIEAGAVAQALDDAKPDAIFNVLFGPDLAKFVREGNTRGIFEKREVVSLLTGEPEYLDPLKDDAPKNWIVTGYPWYLIKTPAHEVFLKDYQAKYKDYPRMASLVGYATGKALAAGIKKAGSTESEKLVASFADLTFDSPAGPITFRGIDHQATLGLYVGHTGVNDGKGVMTDTVYKDGAAFQPSDADVRKRRPLD